MTDTDGDTDSQSFTIAVRVGVPTAPNAPVLTPGSARIMVEWNSPQDHGDPILNYELQWQKSDQPNWSTASTYHISATLPTSYVIRDLTNGIQYSVRVRAVNTVGNSAWSSIAQTTPVDFRAQRNSQLHRSILSRATQTILDGTVTAVKGRVEVLRHSPSETTESKSKPPTPRVETNGGASANFAFPSLRAWTPSDLASSRSNTLSSLNSKNNRASAQTDALDTMLLLAGSSYSVESDPKSTPIRPSVWAAGSYDSLSIQEESLSWNGDVRGLRVGADVRPHPQWLTGVSVNWAEGNFDWNTEGLTGERNDGRYELEMVGITPYVGWSSLDRGFQMWGLLGHSSGDVLLTDSNTDDTHRGNVRVTSMALGARGNPLFDHDIIAGGLTELRTVADGSFAWLDLDPELSGSNSLNPLLVDISRLRLGLEASHARDWGNGGRVSPAVQVSLRSDSRDGHLTTALEGVVGLRVTHPSSGIAIEGRSHVLGAASDGSDEWGVQLQLAYGRGERHKGLSADITTGYGAPGDMVAALALPAANSLWNSPSAELAARLDAELRYGFETSGGRGLVTPHATYRKSGRDSLLQIGGRFAMDDRINLAAGAGLRDDARLENGEVWLTGQLSLGAPSTGQYSRSPNLPSRSFASDQPSAIDEILAGVATIEALVYRIQLGAFSSEVRAQAARETATQRSAHLLDSANQSIVVSGPATDGLWRVHLSQVVDERHTASELCRTLSEQSAGGCYVAEISAPNHQRLSATASTFQGEQ